MTWHDSPEPCYLPPNKFSKRLTSKDETVPGQPGSSRSVCLSDFGQECWSSKYLVFYVEKLLLNPNQ